VGFAQGRDHARSRTLWTSRRDMSCAGTFIGYGMGLAGPYPQTIAIADSTPTSSSAPTTIVPNGMCIAFKVRRTASLWSGLGMMELGLAITASQGTAFEDNRSGRRSPPSLNQASIICDSATSEVDFVSASCPAAFTPATTVDTLFAWRERHSLAGCKRQMRDSRRA
jgi:hypothetical protein